jgi:hypothetical protein
MLIIELIPNRIAQLQHRLPNPIKACRTFRGGHEFVPERIVELRHRPCLRVARLREIEPIAQAVREQGDSYPLLTLRMGVAVHQAIVDACEEFAREGR